MLAVVSCAADRLPRRSNVVSAAAAAALYDLWIVVSVAILIDANVDFKP